MKKESNIINTKDELIKNFSKEQMEIYNYYKSKFSYEDKELYPIAKEDKELIRLEKSYNVLNYIFKVELVFAFVVITFIIMFYGVPASKKSQVKYKPTITASEEAVSDTRI